MFRRWFNIISSMTFSMSFCCYNSCRCWSQTTISIFSTKLNKQRASIDSNLKINTRNYLSNFISNFFDFRIGLCLSFFENTLEEKRIFQIKNISSNEFTIFSRLASSFNASIRCRAASRICSWRRFKSFSSWANFAALRSSSSVTKLKFRKQIKQSKRFSFEFTRLIFLYIRFR